MPRKPQITEVKITEEQVDNFLKTTGDLSLCYQKTPWQAENLKSTAQELLVAQKNLSEAQKNTSSLILFDLKSQVLLAQLTYLKTTYDIRSYNGRSYVHFYGRFFGCPVNAKLKAANEMIFYLKNIEYDAQSSAIKLPDEQLLKNFMKLDASIFGRLGKIRSKMLELLKEAVATNKTQGLKGLMPG